MKNIQIIDDAQNCTYSVYSISDKDFKIIFPQNKQDVEFNTDLASRLDSKELTELNKRIWENPVNKKSVNGIDGTVFYNFDNKKKYYPTKIENEMKTIL